MSTQSVSTDRKRIVDVSTSVADCATHWLLRPEYMGTYTYINTHAYEYVHVDV